MLTLLQIAPFLFAASIATAIYLVHMLAKIRESEVPRIQETSRMSLTARSMHELTQSIPNYAPFVEIMRSQVRRNREGFQGSSNFLDEAEKLLGRSTVDALSFGILYELYMVSFLSKENKNN